VGYAGLHGKYENYNLHLEQKRLPYTRLLLILRGWYSTLWKIYIPYIMPAVCKNDFPLWAFLGSCIQLGKNLPSVRLTQETTRLVSAYEMSDRGGVELNDFYVVIDHHWLWIFLQTGGVLSEATPSTLVNIGECRQFWLIHTGLRCQAVAGLAEGLPGRALTPVCCIGGCIN